MVMLKLLLQLELVLELVVLQLDRYLLLRYGDLGLL